MSLGLYLLEKREVYHRYSKEDVPKNYLLENFVGNIWISFVSSFDRGYIHLDLLVKGFIFVIKSAEFLLNHSVLNCYKCLFENTQNDRHP